MSAILLAELLDELSDNGAYLLESYNSVSASNLSFEDIKKVSEITKDLSWKYDIFDDSGSKWEFDLILPEFAPYRINIYKPFNEESTLILLTNSGLRYWLKSEHSYGILKIARLTNIFSTHSISFQPWDVTASFDRKNPTKNPRLLVREFGSERNTPEDIRPWLLQDPDAFFINDESSKIWAINSTIAIFQSIANEFDSSENTLKFKGPPNLSIEISSQEINKLNTITTESFRDLQKAAIWVFENEREAELRHSLLANDIAISSSGIHEDMQSIIKNISKFLDGAKIAYQVSLSELGRDTLKILADLKKTVSEETAKVTDATRQMSTSITGALAISLGLIAMRINSNISYSLISSIMVVLIIYVGIVIYSGYGFITLQRQLRNDWQSRLYRFLPIEEYNKMVTKPSNKAEKTFTIVAIGGATSIILLAAVVFLSWSSTTNEKEKTNKTTVKINQENKLSSIPFDLKFNINEIIKNDKSSK